MRYVFVPCLLILGACQTGHEPKPQPRDVYKTFGETHALIKNHTEPVILSDGARQVLVAPAFAGRVMVSTLDGDEGLALGWIKPEVVTGAMRDERFVNYGAAERMWLAPEGSQFALYFPPEQNLSSANWIVPASFNHTKFPVVSASPTAVTMEKEIELENWSRTKFKLRLKRTISMLPAAQVADVAGVPVPDGVKYVAYQTHNVVGNAADTAMARSSGLVAIWMLGMFATEGDVTIILPYVPDAKGGTGPKVKSNYGSSFNIPPPERLKVLDDPPVVLFKGDANFRSKIGLSPQRTTGVMGSMDWKRTILTLVKTPVVEPNGLYVENAWEPDKRYGGDAVNSYNDGPAGVEGEQFGFFYELETLSPAKELKPNEELVHDNFTLHFQGSLEALNGIAQKALGVDLTKLPRL